MTCSCAHTLLAEATYQVSVGETFTITVDAAEATTDTLAELRTALDGGSVAASFTAAIGEAGAGTVTFRVQTLGLEPGVYYFDLFGKVLTTWTCLLRRGGLVVVGAVTVRAP